MSSDSANVSQSGIIKRLEALIALAVQRGAAALAYITATRTWDGLHPTAPLAVTNAYNAAYSQSITPKTSGKVRIIASVQCTCDATPTTLLVGVSVGSGIIVPLYALATPMSIAASSTIQATLQVDLDKLSAPALLPVGTPSLINVLVLASANGHLTVPTAGVQLECQEVP